MMILIGAGIILASLCILTIYISYREVFYAIPKAEEDAHVLPKGEQYKKNEERMHSLIREMEELPYELLFIQAWDKTRLVGRYYHVQDGAPFQIQLHGYRGMAIRDFCGGNKLAREMGHNTIVVDERAHGRSTSRTITFGIKERKDCLSWVHYVCEHFGSDTPIFLSGVSMGAAAVLMASDLDLPQNVIGIIADSPYSSPAAIIAKVCKDRGLPPSVLLPIIRLGARCFGHFDLEETTAIDAVRRTRIPILLIHGEDDRFVPCRMSQEIWSACSGPRTIKTFPGAGHGLSYMADTKRYERLVKQFVGECLQRQELSKNFKK